MAQNYDNNGEKIVWKVKIPDVKQMESQSEGTELNIACLQLLVVIEPELKAVDKIRERI